MSTDLQKSNLARIHEIYLSLSGEGISTGIPTVFVRFAGCSLRCGKADGQKLWCDTPYALSFSAGEEKTTNQILTEVESIRGKLDTQILLTGGEPLEGINRKATIDFLIQRSELIQSKEIGTIYPLPRIETNGAEPIQNIDFAVFTLDYKLPGSGMESKMEIENLRVIKERNNPLDEIKFVIRNRKDFERSLEIVDSHSPNCNLLYSCVFDELSPQTLSDWLKEDAPKKARLSLQIHKVLWGEKRGV